MKVRGQPSMSALLGILVLLPASLILWGLAYQAPLHQTVLVGGDTELLRRYDDDPFLSGVNGSEPADQVDDPERPGERLWWWELLERTGGQPYRWTKAETTFLVPGAGRGLYTVDLRASGRPGGAPTLWEAGPGLRYELTLPNGEPRHYRILAAADRAGDLRVTMRTTPYSAPRDPRELGFVLYELRVSPAQRPPYTPAWPQLGWLALALAGVYLAALASGAPPWGAAALGALGALGAAYALAMYRPALTLFTPTLALLAGLGTAASLGGLWASRRLAHRGALAADLAPVLGLVAAAFALRMAGMLHPHALYSDAGLQANKLFEVILGNVFLTAGLPSDAGGGQAPYPPGPFLTLMPLELVFPAGRAARVLLMQTGTALLDSLTVALIWLMMRRAGLGQAAALLGAACYLLPVAALESLAVGELANVGGQALAMPFIVLLAIGAAASTGTWSPGDHQTAMGEYLHWHRLSERADRRSTFYVLRSTFALTVALAVGLVAHSGVTLSVGAMVAAAWGLALTRALLRRDGGPISAARLSVVASVALGLVLLLYYSAPVYVGGMLGRGAVGSSAGTSPGQILAETARAILGLAPPTRRALAIPTLLGMTALAGLVVLWVTRGGQAPAAALRATLAAWWGGTLLTQGLLLVADQGVRWAIFLYPALCLSAGTLLGALWRRGQAGRLAAGLALGAIIAYGLVVWVIQVRDYYHI